MAAEGAMTARERGGAFPVGRSVVLFVENHLGIDGEGHGGLSPYQ
jgi:hypothetical protein